MSDLAAAIAAAGNTGAVLRGGAIIGIDGTNLTVDIGGTDLTQCPYLSTYRPALGDPVQILQQGPVNLVLGATSAVPPYDGAVTPLTNPSFEADPPGAVITDWAATVTGPGTAAITAETAGGIGPKHGAQWLQIAHTGTGITTVTMASAPIVVQPGQRWAASASTTTSTDAAGPAGMAVAVAFLADTAAAYPAGVLSTATQATTAGLTGPQWLPVAATSGNGSLVPDDAGAMRVLLTVAFTAGTVSWDRVLCRRLA